MRLLFPVAEVTRSLSNLFKYGFSGLVNVSEEPFVVDVNSRVINKEPRVIRPVNEKNAEEKEADSGKTDNNSDIAGRAMLDDAMDTAKAIRDDAVLKSAQIVADAQNEAESIMEKAKEEGYKKGYEEGSMEAMKKADQYLENLHKEQESLIAQNNAVLEKNIHDAQTKIVDFACDVIEKFTGILVNDYKPVMLHMINSALNQAETSKKFVIKVAEENYTYVSDNYDRLAGAGNSNISIEIYGDSKLSRSQCIIETDNGIIDLSMDVQVKNLITAIKLLGE